MLPYSPRDGNGMVSNIELASIDPDAHAGEKYSEGLSSQEVEHRLKADGPNELDASEKLSFFAILLTQAKSTIFLLTTVAAIISFIAKDANKGIILMCVVCLVCLANSIGEYSFQDAGAALASMSGDQARVVRDGREQEVLSKNLVMGDVVLLKIGDVVPADMIVLASQDLQAMEAVLTGEPTERLKTVEVKDPKEPFASNMLYKMTSIVGGSGKAEVVATGMRTQVGLIAKRLQNTEKSKKLSPLQRSINMLGKLIAGIIFLAVCLATLIAFLTGYEDPSKPCAEGDWVCVLLSCLLRGVIMSVAIIPHGLPFVVMVMLRVGANQMAVRSAVVTKVTSVDQLSATTVICTDKTGTLTEGKMTAQSIYGICQDEDSLVHSSIGFYPLKGLSANGGIFAEEDLTEKAKAEMDAKYDMKERRQSFGGPDRLDLGACPQNSELSLDAQLARAHLSCASSNCWGTTVSHDPASGKWDAQGNMTEAALRVAAAKAGLWDDKSSPATRIPELEVPFTSKRKMMATLHSLPPHRRLDTLQLPQDASHIALVKGAPDRILPKLGAMLRKGKSGLLEVDNTRLSSVANLAIEKKNQEFASQALRTVLMAIRPLSLEEFEVLRNCANGEDRLDFILSSKLCMLGLWGIYDPPRATVPKSVLECHQAGIQVVMITGDQKPTALAIGQQVNILSQGDSARLGAATCSELHEGRPLRVSATAKRRLSDEALKALGPDHLPVQVAETGGARRLSVHDERTPADQHEPEYKSEQEIAKLTKRVHVWARAQPTDKVAIVESLQHQGHIAAMTGDGVNDAPALTRASVGVSMGISGTSVTKNAADLILMDDDFSTIVAAIKEGRRIYMNAQKYTCCNMSIKGGELLMLLISISVGVPAPIMPLPQIINLLVTHILCTLPFAAEEPEDYAMKIPPRDTKTDLVVPLIMWKFRWLPFIICHAVLGLSTVTIGVWANTGQYLFRNLIGSSVPGDLDHGTVNCEFAGTVTNGYFMKDLEPFHCRCLVFPSGYPIGAREVREQWGRPHAEEYLDQFGVWSGHTGTAFLQPSTPWKDGKEELVEDCPDRHGTKHFCWKAGVDANRPVLPARENCAKYGTMIGQSMSYAAIQLGEILTILTYRRDAFFASTVFSNKFYNICLVGNIAFLILVLYVPPINDSLDLVPLSFGRLLMPIVFACCLALANEFFKTIYRTRKREENKRLQREAIKMAGHVSDESPHFGAAPTTFFSARGIGARLGALFTNSTHFGVRATMSRFGGGSAGESYQLKTRIALLEEGNEELQEKVERIAVLEDRVRELELQLIQRSGD